ncbi:W2 domain-containing protein [Plasmodiophora brassicae]|uniref:W2 domain-containing protein n=1 Tax=Plasmodiophora brassicae TaxID=37360 RepID=A0A0G4IGR9_PLABS|nr:hypothetical protein PBRA_000085 [Plasmodiophora brassicae]SPQ96654.1 unnamed protein product [Plasmodiophora brassicae]
MSGKKKAVKMSWQEMQMQFGTTSARPIDNLPTAPRAQQGDGYLGFRHRSTADYADRERRRDPREENEEMPSRADEAGQWRSSATPSSRNEDRGRSSVPFGRSDDASQWRSAAPVASSGGFRSGSGGRDIVRRDEPSSAGRPRLNLVKPSAERLAAAQEANAEAATKKAAEPDKKPSPFGDAKPTDKASPFGDARPVLTKDTPKASTFGDAKPVASKDAPKANPFGDAKPVVSKDAPKASPFGDAKPVGTKDVKPAAPSSQSRSPFGDARPVATKDTPAEAKPSPFGDANPVDKVTPAKPTETKPAPAKMSPFGEARPAEEPASAAADRRPLVRLTHREGPSSELGASSRFARPPREEPVPSSRLPPARAEPPPRTVRPAEPKPVAVAEKYPVAEVPDLPVDESLPASRDLERSVLARAMSEATWVSADDLADGISSIDLSDEHAAAALSDVLCASLREHTVILPSALSLLPGDRAADITEQTLRKYAADESPAALKSLVSSSVPPVDVIAVLGLTGKSRPELEAALESKGLAVLMPEEDIAGKIAALCANLSTPPDQIVKEIASTGKKASTKVARIVGEYVAKKSLASGKAFDAGVIESCKGLLQKVVSPSSVKSQVQLLFGAQPVCFAQSKAIKRCGRLLFESLYDHRIVSIDGLVAWMQDNTDPAEGKRQVLLQVGGFISEVQNSAIAREEAVSESDEDSVDLSGDFPQANRNYEY